MKRTISLCKGAVEFNNPTGLCVLNEHVYVCDEGSNSIKVLNGDLEFVKSFGEEILKSPRDIKYKDDKLIALTKCENTIHTFNKQHIYLRPIHLTGQKNDISPNPFFTRDLEGNFIICDPIGNCLKSFRRAFRVTRRWILTATSSNRYRQLQAYRNLFKNRSQLHSNAKSSKQFTNFSILVS